MSGPQQSGGVFASTVEQAVVTVSGENIFDFRLSPTDSNAVLKIDNNGNMYKSQDTGTRNYLLVDSATDWIRPTSFAPGDYEVRFTSATNTPTFSTVAENVWRPLSSGDMIIRNTITGVGVKTTTFTVQIRKGTGAVLDSASYTIRAEVEFDTIFC